MVRKSLIIAAVSLGALALAPSVFAEEGDHQERMNKHFEKVDTNGDGSISKSEREAAKVARFAEIDSDNNGEVSVEEMEAHKKARHEKRKERHKAHKKHSGERHKEHGKERHKERLVKHFNEMDKDGNGTLSQDELKDRHAKRFEDADKDGDGSITKEEMKNAHKDRKKNHHGKWRKHHDDPSETD